MCSGSSVWAGRKPISELHALESLTETGTTFKSELHRIGYLGPVPCSHRSITTLSAHFELHIEQASRLERSSNTVGVVTGVQGMRWLSITIIGREGHAGSTALPERQDAMVAASTLVLYVQSEAKRVDGFGTVGFFKPRTESPNQITGEVRLMIDLRHQSDAVLDEQEANFKTFLQGLKRSDRISDFTFARTWDNPSVSFDPDALRCVRKAAANTAVGSSMDLISWAGHDSAETAHACPTAMIFVPSRDGISHNPKEWTDKEHWYVRSIRDV